MLIKRKIEDQVLSILKWSPSVVLLGPRQIGKTTLANIIRKELKKPSIYIDLEDPDEITKISFNKLFFDENADKCLIIDEIQRYPELFALIRSSIDKNRVSKRFILLGSASPLVLKNATESLTGRTVYIEIAGINISEINSKISNETHWFRGGYPIPLMLDKEQDRIFWFKSFLRNYIEFDLPQIGYDVPSLTTNRLISMIATTNGSLWNASRLSNSLGISNKYLSLYRDYLEKTYLIRVLPPYFANAKKRLIKSPKIYIRDSGILHYLTRCYNFNDLLGNPIIGSSWEGYVIEQIINFINANISEEYSYTFFRTKDGSEIDFVILKGIVPFISIEIKISPNPSLSRGVTNSILYLKTKHNYVIVPKCEYSYNLSNGFKVSSLSNFLNELKNLDE